MTLKLRSVGLGVLFLAFLFLPFTSSSAASGKIENFGSKYVFNPGNSAFISTTPLSSSKYVIVFSDVAHSNHGVAMVASVSGRTVTYGPQAIFDPNAVSFMSVAAIKDDRFSIAYADGGNSNKGTIITGTVGGGDAISFTSAWVYSTGSTAIYYNNRLSLLDYDLGTNTGWLVVGYSEGASGNIGRVSVISVEGDGTTTDLGSRTTFNAAATSYVHTSALSPSSFLVAFTDDSDSYQGTAMAATVVGYIPTFGAELDYNAGATSLNELATLTSTKAVVAYSDDGTSSLGRSRILSVSGTVVSAGTVETFSALFTTEVDDIIALSTSSFIVAYANADLDWVTLVVQGNVSETTITYDTAHYYHTTMFVAASLTYLTATKFAVSFSDGSNSNYGTSMVADLPIFLHPIGTLMRVKEPYSPIDPKVYIATNTYEKSWVPNPSVFTSQFDWSKIVSISFSEVVDYSEDGGYYPYRDCELVREEGTAPVYVFENGLKRHIASPTIMDQYHFTWSNIVVPPLGSLSIYEDGADLASYADNTYPNGCLLRANNAPQVYYLDSGGKRHIQDPVVFSSQFSWSEIIVVDFSVLSDINYPVGTTYPYRSGELVREEDTAPIYVFENGLKRHIVDPGAFVTYDYSWSNVQIAPAGSLAVFGNGSDISISN